MTKRKQGIDEALEVIAGALRGSITAGSEVRGTLIEHGGELEVEVTLRVTRRVDPANATDYRARALKLLAQEPWRDHCPNRVKDRGPWSVTKNKSCSNKVTTVIVRDGYADEVGPLKEGATYRRQLPAIAYHFACSHHADELDRNVIAVVRLEKGHLRTLRAKRQRENEERWALEREAERKAAGRG
jgi:hypothetical protein